MSGKLHLDGTTSSNNGVGFESTSDDHDGVIKGSLGFFKILGGTSSEDESCGLG